MRSSLARAVHHSRRILAPPSIPAARNSGFSLVELVVVVIVVAILAVVALPRLADKTSFDALGFYQEVQAVTRYAQKEAIAKRRKVCIVFGANTVTLTFAKAEGVAASCDSGLVSPRGASPFVVIAQSGIAFSPTPTGFFFDALGRPSTGQTIVISGDGTRSFTVESETGYVHP